MVTLVTDGLAQCAWLAGWTKHHFSVFSDWSEKWDKHYLGKLKLE